MELLLRYNTIQYNKILYIGALGLGGYGGCLVCGSVPWVSEVSLCCRGSSIGRRAPYHSPFVASFFTLIHFFACVPQPLHWGNSHALQYLKSSGNLQYLRLCRWYSALGFTFLHPSHCLDSAAWIASHSRHMYL